MLAAAVALNVAVVAPAVTVTAAGTLSEVLLLASVTLDPPVGAAWLSAAVHVLTLLALNEEGEQVTDEREGTTIVSPVVGVTLKPSPIESVSTAFDI